MTGQKTSESTRYKLDGSFVVVSEANFGVNSDGGRVVSYAWRSPELGGYIKGTSTTTGSAPTSAGQSADVLSGAVIYSDFGCTSSTGVTVYDVTFYDVSKSIVGDGSLSVSPIFGRGDNYVASGTITRITASAASGYSRQSFLVNGVDYTVAGTMTLVPSANVVASASFVFSSYRVIQPVISPTGSGTVVVKRLAAGSSGTPQTITTFPQLVNIGDTLTYTCTPIGAHSFSNIVINGTASTESETSMVVSVSSTTGDITSTASFPTWETKTNTLQVVGGVASTSVDIYYGASKIADKGNATFSCYVGESYSVIVTAGTGRYLYGIYVGSQKVSSVSPFNFVQGNSPIALRVVITETDPSPVVTLYCGSSSASTDTTWNGCTCSKSHSGSTYTFVPSAAAGYSFVSLYIEDLDDTGKGKVIAAGSSLTTTIDFNAKVVAIFKSSSAPVEPADSDQGGNPSLTSASVYQWEGNFTRMTATWASRRNVFMKPVSLSCARLYADGYYSGGPLLNIRQYHSPQATDVATNKVSMVVPSESAVRLTARRPEKYVELEVVGSSNVLEVSVSTSMEGLCRQNI